jgi:hypothetical protein
MKNKLVLASLCLLTYNLAFAQEPEMADTMRSEGKIYVLVAIISTILLGLLVYLFVIERKVTRMEKRLSEKK